MSNSEYWRTSFVKVRSHSIFIVLYNIPCQIENIKLYLIVSPLKLFKKIKLFNNSKNKSCNNLFERALWPSSLWEEPFGSLLIRFFSGIWGKSCLRKFLDLSWFTITLCFVHTKKLLIRL